MLPPSPQAGSPLTIPSSFTQGIHIHPPYENNKNKKFCSSLLAPASKVCLLATKDLFCFVLRFFRPEKSQLKTYILLWVYGSFEVLCLICLVSSRNFSAGALSASLPTACKPMTVVLFPTARHPSPTFLLFFSFGRGWGEC